ncbi:cartilage matrix protein [Octopus bimaculoides]|nr:cartilage matrix protein [Octopus bimaculoides]|eukprot:XP_014785070.1 PREDICTED: cartilage matrix protein-like [Octopus bimaculoides]
MAQKRTLIYCWILTFVSLVNFQTSICEDHIPLKCYGTPADLVFVVDSSSSIWPSNFRKQLEFIHYMINRLDVGMNKLQVRVGIVTFSDWAMVNVYLMQSRDKSVLKWKIGLIKQIQGKTNIANALNTLFTRVYKSENGARPGVKRIAILLTDGISQTHTTAALVAKRCRKENIEIFAIGIGNRIRYDELSELVSRPRWKYLIHASSYEDLNRIKDDIVRKTCRNLPLRLSSKERKRMRKIQTGDSRVTDDIQLDAKVCRNIMADVYFLMDSSSSIRKTDFRKQLHILRKVISKFQIGSNKTRVAVSFFTHQFLPVWKLNDLQDKSEILRRIRSLKYLGGATKTDYALYKVRTQGFIWRNQQNAYQILIVFTDGQSRDYKRTRYEAKLLKQRGVKIFVVGIGSYVDKEELNSIASTPSIEYVHTFDSFDSLSMTSGILNVKACSAVRQMFFNDQNVCNKTQETDLMFIVNNHLLGYNKTEKIVNVVAEIIELLGKESPIRTGMMYDDCETTEDIPLGSLQEKTAFIQKIDKIKFNSFAGMIRKLRLNVFPVEDIETKNSSRRIGFLFLDEVTNINDFNVIREVKLSLGNGIQLYVVVIGDRVDISTIERNIAPRERIIIIPSYNDLKSLLPSKFTEKLCRLKESLQHFQLAST